jgi:hypothetical protein
MPHTAKPIPTNIIAEGEKTGHNHMLNGSHQIYETADNHKYFEAKQELEIKHPEHNTIIIPKGIYTVVHERSFNPCEDIEIEVID